MITSSGSPKLPGAFFGSRARLFLSLVLAVTVNACNHDGVTASTEALPVRVITVGPISAFGGLRFAASIVPESEVALSFKSPGFVEQVLQVRGPDGRPRNVEQGDWIRKGTVLATVRQDEYLNAVEQGRQRLARAQAELDDSKLNFDRAAALYAAESLTKTDYDAAKARFDSATATAEEARAGLANAQIGLDDCLVKAPMDGWLLNRTVDVGSLVGPSTVGFTLANTRLVKAIFGVPDRSLDRVQPGSLQVVTTDAVPGQFEGRITAVSASADPASRVYSVEVTIPNPRNRLRAGMIASLVLEDKHDGSGANPLPGIPIGALVRPAGSGQGYAVFVVSGVEARSTAQLRPVEVGQMYGNQIAVTKGLRIGDRVITTGLTMVQDGRAVQVMP